ncbi:hypothetical protein THAOC_20647, partial [Thalassiosira oceanica]
GVIDIAAKEDTAVVAEPVNDCTTNAIAGDEAVRRLDDDCPIAYRIDDKAVCPFGSALRLKLD